MYQKRPANTVQGDEPCPKRTRLQDPDQPKASSQGEKTNDSTGFCPSLLAEKPATRPIEESTVQHPYETRSKAQPKPKTYNETNTTGLYD